MNNPENATRAADYFTIRAIDAESDRRIIAIGNKMASPIVFDNEEEAKQAIENKDWDLILSMIFAACDARELVKQNKEEEK